MDEPKDSLAQMLEEEAAALERERYPGDLVADVRRRLAVSPMLSRRHALRWAALAAAAAAILLVVLMPKPEPGRNPSPRPAASAIVARPAPPVSSIARAFGRIPRPSFVRVGRRALDLPTVTSMGSGLGRAFDRVRGFDARALKGRGA